MFSAVGFIFVIFMACAAPPAEGLLKNLSPAQKTWGQWERTPAGGSLPAPPLKQAPGLKLLNRIQAGAQYKNYKQTLALKETNLKKFCRRISRFTQNKQFTLHHYARLDYYLHCEVFASLELDSYPPYMQKKAAGVWLKKSLKLNDTKEIIASSYRLYKLSSNKNKKEAHLKSALRLARIYKDPRLKQWEEQLKAMSPRYIKNPSLSQMLNTAHDFRRVRDFKKAIFYYRKLLNSSKAAFQDKHHAFKWLRWIYKDQNNKAKYLKASEEWKQFLKRSIKTHKSAGRFYYEASSLLARSLWTLGRTQEALNSLKQTEKVLKKGRLFEVNRLRGFIYEELGQSKKAVYFFKKALKEPTQNIEAKEKTKWRLAWILSKIKNFKESLLILNSLLKETKNDYLKSRILFWVGRFYKQTGQKKQAVKSFKLLVKTDPLSYYGMLAHHELKIPITINPPAEVLKSRPLPSIYNKALWLTALNQYKDAEDLLRYQLQKNKKEFLNDSKPPADLFYCMALAKVYLPLFQAAGRLDLKKRTKVFKNYADWLFPMRWPEEVKQAGRLFNIEKELIYALIRQESAYNPKARSPSDAFGLMQIRPATARQTARAAGIRYRRTKDLYNPKTNILLGTAYLKKQFQHYHFQFIVTLAAYNAGGVHIKRWLKREKHPKALLFIEDIPFEETRIYVMLLIRNFVFYKLLARPSRSLYFPDWILHLARK